MNKMDIRSIKEDEVLVREGDLCEKIYVVLKGEITAVIYQSHILIF